MVYSDIFSYLRKTLNLLRIDFRSGSSQDRFDLERKDEKFEIFEYVGDRFNDIIGSLVPPVPASTHFQSILKCNKIMLI